MFEDVRIVNAWEAFGEDDHEQELAEIARRPRRFDELAGNQVPLELILREIRNQGVPPSRLLLHGPTGSGKTTVGRLLARRRCCVGARPGEVEPCGRCGPCSMKYDAYFGGPDGFYEITGATLTEVTTENWRWLRDLIKSRRTFLLLDELQDASKLAQSILRTDLEDTNCIAVATTTHLNLVDEALRNRFGVRAYELRRPTPDEAVEVLERWCNRLGLTAGRDQLLRIATQLQLDLRKCVNAAFTAAGQAKRGIITDAWIDAALGPPSDAIPQRGAGRRPLI
jgi:replication-associated recombination protein RarA